MFESKILAAFIHDRKHYDMAQPHIDRDDLSPMGTVMLEILDDYYSKDTGAEHADLEVLRLRIDRKFKDIPKHKDKAHDFLIEIDAEKASDVNVISEVILQKRGKVMTLLADALLAQDENLIGEHMLAFEELTDATVLDASIEDEYSGVTLDELEEQFKEDGAWNLAPYELSQRIKGGLRPGHSVVVAARPERGKTLFGTFFNAGFLQQGARTLYIGNEDPVPDLVLRLLSCLTGWTEEQMFAHKDEAMAAAIDAGYLNCTLVGLSPGTLYEIEALIRRHEPDIVIVDQMRNVRANTENNTQRLEVVAQELRNMARRHNCVMISMTQVGDSGRDKLILNDGDIDGSNTGIPGACDVIVMVGSNEEFELRDLRRITIAKNKRGGNHDNFTVQVQRDLSRVKSHV